MEGIRGSFSVFWHDKSKHLPRLKKTLPDCSHESEVHKLSITAQTRNLKYVVSERYKVK